MQRRNQTPAKIRRGAPWQRRLTRFFSKLWVELSIGALVLVSVVLTLAEFTLGAARQNEYPLTLSRVELFNDIITWVFVVELSLRFAAAPIKRRFFREYWIDILAVLPLFRVFRTVRALRLFRLVRLLRMFGVASRLSIQFPEVIRRGALEYFFVCGLLALTVLFGTGAMMFFEGSGQPAGPSRVAGSDPSPATRRQTTADTAIEQEDPPFNLKNAFWFSVYSLFAGEPIPGPPKSMGGKLVAVFVMFMGLTIFAMFTGTVSAFMVDRLRRDNRVVNWDELHDHVIVCGWNSKAEIIVREFRASPLADEMRIVVIAQFDHEPPPLEPDLQKFVVFLNEDFTRVAALEQVGVHRAKTCIIMADTSNGRSEQDADARTILAALTVEKLNPAVYTCAELLNRSYGTHLQMGHVNDYVVSGEYGAYMLAQAAMNRGLMGVFTELLTWQHGNEFYRLGLPADWLGKPFNELFVYLKTTHNATLVGVHRSDGRLRINPSEYIFDEGDEIVVIAERELELR